MMKFDRITISQTRSLEYHTGMRDVEPGSMKWEECIDEVEVKME